MSDIKQERTKMISSINDRTLLNNGTDMPWLGFGVYKIKDEQEVVNSVKYALETGYRSIDTASVYGNEEGVGRAIRESGIPRGDIFLTTKVWNDDQRGKRTLEAFEESLKRLKTEYVDLYLIHWPVKDYYKDTWHVMEKIYQSGRARAIGVSNFMIHHLEELKKTASIMPMVNQIKLCPGDTKDELVSYCRENGILVEAYSPLGTGKVFKVPELIDLASKI